MRVNTSNIIPIFKQNKYKLHHVMCNMYVYQCVYVRVNKSLIIK